MQQSFRLLRLLADGKFHSGEQLGDALGIGRSAVWKHVRALEALGLDFFAVSGKGYRLAQPLELLESDRILAELGVEDRKLSGGLEIFTEIDSTNRYLALRLADGLPDGYACFAEYQSAGRGRRGRTWISPFGANIYVSVYRRFESSADALQGLSLAVGIGAIRALQAVGVSDVGLKWPNDLVWRKRKLGGLLLEMSGEHPGPWHVISGLGLNVGVPASAAARIDQPWTDLRAIKGVEVSRNRVAGQLLKHLLQVLDRFAREGLAPFRQEWLDCDVTRDKSVDIDNMGRLTRGVARGVDETGALLLEVDGRVERVMSGDVSMRLAKE